MYPPTQQIVSLFSIGKVDELGVNFVLILIVGVEFMGEHGLLTVVYQGL